MSKSQIMTSFTKLIFLLLLMVAVCEASRDYQRSVCELYCKRLSQRLLFRSFRDQKYQECVAETCDALLDGQGPEEARDPGDLAEDLAGDQAGDQLNSDDQSPEDATDDYSEIQGDQGDQSGPKGPDGPSEAKTAFDAAVGSIGASDGTKTDPGGYLLRKFLIFKR